MEFFLTIIFKGINRIKCLFFLNIMPSINRMKLRAFGIRHDKNCRIMGVCTITTGKSSLISIGKNFRLVSSNLINPLCDKKACICVSDNAHLQIGDNCGMSSPTIWVRKSVKIGNNVNLGGGCVLFDTDAHSLNYLHRHDGLTDMANRIDKEIIIDDDVLIGANTCILKGVHIGARSVIGAGSVVTKDIPADSIAAGNPAKIIKKINVI
ncbi:acyltransferase [Parabacteroides faecis]|uniref:acyltransferase n=1 Tax=Parabacteroides faecis TaxID=1217282 RepID=UPI002164E8DC|nr:acyltransferase [Parabacteroides faecis]MCS2894178.1 acyltransferase [Parabacteroides faecis]UVQ47233.1 acyltransferase [Parabacteroides faecis]